MLAICVDCRKIIGCINAKGEIVQECVFCKRFYECQEETPIGFVVQRRVMFVHFTNGCNDHERNQIGFKRNV